MFSIMLKEPFTQTHRGVQAKYYVQNVQCHMYSHGRLIIMLIKRPFKRNVTHIKINHYGGRLASVPPRNANK